MGIACQVCSQKPFPMGLPAMLMRPAHTYWVMQPCCLGGTIPRGSRVVGHGCVCSMHDTVCTALCTGMFRCALVGQQRAALLSSREAWHASSCGFRHTCIRVLQEPVRGTTPRQGVCLICAALVTVAIKLAVRPKPLSQGEGP